MVMAKKSISETIESFKKDHLELYDYCKPENMASKKFDSKYTIKIGKRIESNLVEIFSTEEGILQFEKLLDDDNIIISAMAAKDLYPRNPEKCLFILNKFLDYTYDKLAVRDLINGLKNKEAFFMNRLQHLYGNNFDIDQLLGEKDS